MKQFNQNFKNNNQQRETNLPLKKKYSRETALVLLLCDNSTMPSVTHTNKYKPK
jgi:hypothetical protein